MSETKASANKEKKYGMNKERVELRAEIREVLFDQAYSINVRGYEGDALNKIEAIFEAHTKQAIAEVLERVRELEDALWFYANPQVYFAIAFLPDPPCGAFMEDFNEDKLTKHYQFNRQMPGKRARKVLKKAINKELKELEALNE